MLRNSRLAWIGPVPFSGLAIVIHCDPQLRFRKPWCIIHSARLGRLLRGGKIVPGNFAFDQRSPEDRWLI
jgi:hypothetical protein